MSTKVKINRLATGVPGLDDVMGGGLPEFSFNLIGGPPGCGKTTLAHQIMFALAAHGGEVTVFSAGRDRGSRFVVTLPLIARADSEAAV